MKDVYAESLEAMDRWLRPTGTPGLIAKCERMAELSGAAVASRRTAGTAASSSATTLTGTPSTSRTGDAMTVRVGPVKREPL